LHLFWLEYRRNRSLVKKRKFKIFFLAFCVGYLASVDYIPAYGFAVYPIGYVAVFAFLVLIARGIWRYRLLDITSAFAADQIIKTMADALLVIDDEATVRVANVAACSLFGGHHRKLEGNPASVIGADFFKNENISRLLCSGKVQHSEIQYFSDSRGYVLLEISSSVIRDSRSHGIALVCIIKDITGRRQAEDALRESEKRYRLLADHMTDMIWVMDMNLKPLYISPSVARLRGFQTEEMMGQSFEQWLAPGSVKAFMSVVAEEMMGTPQNKESKSHTLEFEFLCKNGSAVSTESRLTFLREACGRIKEILGIARDISERKRAEESLREAEASYSELLQEMQDPVLILDRLGYVQAVNLAAENLLGFSSSEIAGKHLGKAGLLAQNSVARSLQELTLTLLGWQRPAFELHFQKKGSGDFLTLEANSKLVGRDKDSARVQIILRETPSRFETQQRGLSA